MRRFALTALAMLLLAGCVTVPEAGGEPVYDDPIFD